VCLSPNLPKLQLIVYREDIASRSNLFLTLFVLLASCSQGRADDSPPDFVLPPGLSFPLGTLTWWFFWDWVVLWLAKKVACLARETTGVTLLWAKQFTLSVARQRPSSGPLALIQVPTLPSFSVAPGFFLHDGFFYPPVFAVLTRGLMVFSLYKPLVEFLLSEASIAFFILPLLAPWRMSGGHSIFLRATRLLLMPRCKRRACDWPPTGGTGAPGFKTV